MADSAADRPVWTPWSVAPESGFFVADEQGHVRVVQLDEKNFWVENAFEFRNDEIERDLVEAIMRSEDDGGQGKSEAEARRAVDDARRFTPNIENPTDLASIPRFMRWFENPYGVHTLAAIIHDELIADEPNAGSLGSDTLSDRFFREMMRAVGVPWLKRWVMWAAVALRTRFAAGGIRRISVCIWLVLAASGIVSFVVGVLSWRLDWSGGPDPMLLLVIAVVLPFASTVLWGKQRGASLVAAVAALWILPAALFAIVGYVVYRVLELGARIIRLR
jgi:hypothetical protein